MTTDLKNKLIKSATKMVKKLRSDTRFNDGKIVDALRINYPSLDEGIMMCIVGA